MQNKHTHLLPDPDELLTLVEAADLVVGGGQSSQQKVSAFKEIAAKQVL